MKNKHLLLLFMLAVLFTLLAEPLLCVSAEENDLVFIINLYEHGQYDLAKKQIAFFETEYKDSAHKQTITFMRAKIAFFGKDYGLADSLYTILLHSDIDNEMLFEVLINKAEIRYEWNDHISALGFLTRSESATNEPDKKYRIELLRGKIQLALFDPVSAQQSFERALVHKVNDPVATFELMKACIAANDIGKARTLASEISDQPNAAFVHTSALNKWLDYLISMEEYEEAARLETRLFDGYPDSLRLRFARINYLVKNYDNAWDILSQTTGHSAFRSYLTGLLYVEQGNEAAADSIFAVLSQGRFGPLDVLPDSDDDLAVMSWLERIKLSYKEDPAFALRNLETYLAGFEPDQRDPHVLYVYASLLFKNMQYQEAINALLQVRKMALTPEFNHNVSIMLGDIWFNAKVPVAAKQAYNNYLNQYPRGKFRAHALYNIALINFEQKEYDEATAQLNAVFQSDADLEIMEKAKYLSAEISFFQSSYNKAIEQYLSVNPNYIDKVVIDYRIAQCLYYLENYQAAAEYIPKLLSDTANAFQILILHGNIYFNLKQYEAALTVYNDAKSRAKDDADRFEVDSYIALTLYRLRRFDEAQALYLQLSQEEETPGAYLIMAAKAAYHSREYQQALLLFNQFITEHPNDENYNFALANIGSIHYNLGEHSRAIDTWMSLLRRYKTNAYFTEDEQVILSSVFSGMLYSLRLSPNQKALDEIDTMATEFTSEYIRFELQYLLLRIYFGSELWSDIIDMADKLREDFPDRENNEIRRYVAASLGKLDRITEADSVYRQIFTLEPNAEILTEWAELEIQAENFTSAVQKLDLALSYDIVETRFVKLLQVLFDYAPDSLDVYWNKWNGEFTPVPERAQLLWMLWNFAQNEWNTAEFMAQGLLLNPDYQIRSQAQFVLGACKYYTKDYDRAVIELYKTVYLYPDVMELVLEAKRLIIHSYIGSEQYAEARKVFDEMQEFLTPAQKQEITTKLNAEGK
ncbi:MAG: tetratricopeptide repeat protein [Candidatus Cloacimonadaceae bacterium]